MVCAKRYNDFLVTCWFGFFFQEGIVERLFKWAQEAEQPLRIYATGLLAGAMENQDIAANYREENSVLVSKGGWGGPPGSLASPSS